MRSRVRRFAWIVLVAAALIVPGRAAADIVAIAAGGAPASIQQTVDDFRSLLGTLNPPMPGSRPNGRREINWDGVPDQFASPNYLPDDFFNVNSPRGIVYSTDGDGFRVSANADNPTHTPVRFGEINPQYPSIFQTFSPQKLFTPLGSTLTVVDFFVPGQTDPAASSGFGAVFTNVRFPDTTSISFFDADYNLLATLYVPVAPAGGLSFLGVFFDEGERVAHVWITTGTSALGADDDDYTNIVVMDDFIFGEPQSIYGGQ